jgi:hypothetical protein
VFRAARQAHCEDRALAWLACHGHIAAHHAPCELPAAVRLNDLRIVPSGIDQVQFPVLFPRNLERELVADENRRDLGLFLTGGW